MIDVLCSLANSLLDLILYLLQDINERHHYLALLLVVCCQFKLLASLVRLYYSATLVYPAVCRHECMGKNIVITGSSSGTLFQFELFSCTLGLGYETAAILYSKGATVFMLVRDAEKAKRAIEEIKIRFQSTRSEVGHLQPIYVDLTDDATIRLAACHILQSVDHVDVLINNAGIGSQSELQRVGLNRTEKVMQSNFFGHALLTLLLLPGITLCSGRVINVSSLVYNYCEFPIDDMNFEKRKYNGFTAYSNSKCALIMMNRHLSTTTPKASFYSVDPGIVATPIGDHFVEHMFGPRFAWLIQPIARSVYSIIGKTTHQGCQTILYLSVKQIHEKNNGEFFQNCSVAWNQSKLIRNKELCKDLWTTTVTKFYPAQSNFENIMDPSFDSHTYANLLKEAVPEVDSDDDTLSICSSNTTLPCSSSVCGGRWCDDFGTDGEPSADSLFEDPREEEEWTASEVSLVVHPGKYEQPVEFSDEDLEYRNDLFNRKTVSDPGPIYVHSESSDQLDSSTESLSNSESESEIAYYEDDLMWNSSISSKQGRMQAYLEDQGDDDSILYLFPRNIVPDNRSFSEYSVVTDSSESSEEEGRYLSDSDIYMGLMQFKRKTSLPDLATTPSNAENQAAAATLQSAKPENASSSKSVTPKTANHPSTLQKSNEQQKALVEDRQVPSSKEDDPFADFSVDRFTYRLKTDPQWLKNFEQKSFKMPRLTNDQTDFSWLRHLLELLFGEYLIPDTDVSETSSPEFFILTTTPTPFEASLKPWVRNITSTRAYTRVTPRLPWTRKSYPPYSARTVPTGSAASTFRPPTTPFPWATENMQRSLLLNKLTSNLSEKPNEVALPTAKPHFTLSSKANERKDSCERCQPGKECTIRYKGFDTMEPAFQYAYDHSTPVNEMLRSVIQVCFFVLA
uniref:Retinol dehydrogenase 12-like n=1 Tax=Steinernema glaseri TaxID=37863 RepID=A0A1I8A669_9BILA